jgi:hypothetical protein
MIARRIGRQRGDVRLLVVDGEHGLVRVVRGLRHRGADRLLQAGEALGMLRRHGNRVAEAKPMALGEAGDPGLALALVGEQEHAAADAAQHAGELAVERGHALARVDHEEDEVGLLGRRLGLAAHARLEAAAFRILEARGVEDPEAQRAELSPPLPPVARQARRVVDERKAPAGEPVEQRRLADIGPADDGDGEGPLAGRAARRIRSRHRQRSATRSASSVTT